MVPPVYIWTSPHHFDTDPGPSFYLNADPDAAFHSDADPDLTFQNDASPDPQRRSKPFLYQEVAHSGTVPIYIIQADKNCKPSSEF
jgi:hypothetical protein